MLENTYIKLSSEQLHNQIRTKKYKKYTWYWDNPNISYEAKTLYEWLRTYSRNGWCCWPKQETLANKFGKHVRTIRRWLADLVAAGLIDKVNVKISGVWTLTYMFLPHPDMPDGERLKLEEVLSNLRDEHSRAVQIDENQGNMLKKLRTQLAIPKKDEALGADVSALCDVIARCVDGDPEAEKQIREIGEKLRSQSEKVAQIPEAELDRPDTTPDKKCLPPIYKGKIEKEEKQNAPASAEGSQAKAAPGDIGVVWSDPSLSYQDWVSVRKRMYRDSRVAPLLRVNMPTLIGKVYQADKEKRLTLLCVAHWQEKLIGDLLPEPEILADYGFTWIGTGLQTKEQMGHIESDYRKQEEVERQRKQKERRKKQERMDSLSPVQQYRLFLSQYPRKTRQDNEAEALYVERVYSKKIPSVSEMITILRHWQADREWLENDGLYIPGIKKYINDECWKRKIHLIR